MMNNLNRTQIAYLEELLETSSIGTLSTGLASALLHLNDLAIEEVLTLSLICSAICMTSEEDLLELLLQKKLDTSEGADICMRLSNILGGQITNSETVGDVALGEDGLLLENLSLPAAPSHM